MTKKIIKVSQYFADIYYDALEKKKRPAQQVQTKEDLIYSMSLTYSGHKPAINDPWASSELATKYIIDNFTDLVDAVNNGYEVLTKEDDDMLLSMEELADESIDDGEPEN